MMRRWNTRKAATTGSAEMTAPAIKCPQSMLCAPWDNIAIPTGSVRIDALWVSIKGNKNEFQLVRQV